MKEPVSNFQWVCTMRQGGAVQRFHTTRTTRPQCNAAHSWGVGVLLLAVGCSNVALLAYSLLHDMAEQRTGDVPAPAKWHSQALNLALLDYEAEFDKAHGIDVMYAALTEEERMLLKWADLYEFTMYSYEECEMGNRFMLEALCNGINALMKMQPRLAEALSGVYIDVLDLNNDIVNAAQPYMRQAEGVYRYHDA